MPYAEALANHEAPINLCPPGGLSTLNALARYLQVDATPYQTEMSSTQKPASFARVREEECIGCTKCIQACPVDAILGAAKSMHTVITDECSGCELCVPACPVDCIDMIVEKSRALRSNQYRERYHHRLARLENTKTKNAPTGRDTKSYVMAALQRARAKKSSV